MSKQKTAVVTGGANGIGKCIADEFRRSGVSIIRVIREALINSSSC